MTRVSARAYARLVGKHEDTVQKMCRDKKLIARKAGDARSSHWEIDVAASERALSLRYGNTLERELAKKAL